MEWWQMLLAGLAGLLGLFGAGKWACGKIFAAGKWVGEVNSDRKAFKAFTERVENKLDQIFDRLSRQQTVEPGSPLKLTTFGREVSESLNAAGWAAEKAVELHPQVADMEAYEVHAFCTAYVRDQSADDPVFQALVAKGAYEYGTEMQKVREVFVIELRDALLGLTGIEP